MICSKLVKHKAYGSCLNDDFLNKKHTALKNNLSGKTQCFQRAHLQFSSFLIIIASPANRATGIISPEFKITHSQLQVTFHSF